MKLKKHKTYMCAHCNSITMNPYKLHMREFYYSREHKYILGALVKRKTKRRVVLCEACFDRLLDN